MEIKYVSTLHRILGIQYILSDATICIVPLGCVATSGETLCRDNCQLIGMSLIGLARQVQKNRD